MKLASRGLRDMDSGPQSVEDAREREALKVQARRVWVKTFAFGAVLTAVAMVLPAR